MKIVAPAAVATSISRAAFRTGTALYRSATSFGRQGSAPERRIAASDRA